MTTFCAVFYTDGRKRLYAARDVRNGINAVYRNTTHYREPVSAVQVFKIDLTDGGAVADVTEEYT